MNVFTLQRPTYSDQARLQNKFYENSTELDEVGNNSLYTKENLNQKLYHIIIFRKRNEWWIGFSDSASEGSFVWSTPQEDEWKFTNWKTGEPNDYGREEDCATLKKDGYWNDIPCWMTRAFVCGRLFIHAFLYF